MVTFWLHMHTVPHMHFKVFHLALIFMLYVMFLTITLKQKSKVYTFKMNTPRWVLNLYCRVNGGRVTARVYIVICSPAHPHAHMLTHCLPSSTLPRTTLTSPFDDAVKGARPCALTRRWRHNGYKVDVQDQ